MRVTFIDENGGTVTITDPITVEGDVESLSDLSAVLMSALEADAIGMKVNVTRSGGTEAQQQPAGQFAPTVADELSPPWKPWESTEPPSVKLEDWQLWLLRATREGTVKTLEMTAQEIEFLMENCDPGQEHRLFSLVKGHATIAPAGLYVLDRATRAAAGEWQNEAGETGGT